LKINPAKLPPLSTFIFHLFKNLLAVFVLIIIALIIGMSGYHHYEGMSWVDAFVNAAMILSGMGPVTTLLTVGGKIFAGLYALFSGLMFIVIIGLMLAPVILRLFHQIHLYYLFGKK